MIEAGPFTVGLTRIALATRETVDPPTFAVYHEALERETTAEEWEAFTRVLAKCPPRGPNGRPRFPAVVEILDSLAEFRGAPPLSVEAAQAYERVLASAVYTAEAGASWNYRAIAATCGKVAADAFLAAGGHHAFATTWHETDRREKFLREYETGARERPLARLLPAGQAEVERRMLTAGDDGTVREITPQEARAVLRLVEKRAKEGGSLGRS